MGLYGSSGLKSLFSLASLIGQDIVARSITLTQTAVAIATAGRVSSTATTGPAYSSAVSGGQYILFDTNANGGIVSGVNTLTIQTAGASTLALGSGGVTQFNQYPIVLNTGLSCTLNNLLVMGSYTDSSGTPGNATANTATGRAAIASGASSCVISNNLVTAAARIFISPKIRDATGLLPIVSAQVASTSFTVSTTANCTANLTFDWWVIT